MIKVSDVEAGTHKLNIKTLVMGATGAGKTYFASTFPKSYFLLTEPNGEDTFLTIPELRKNVLGFDRFIPESIEDTKPMFDNLEKCCKEAKQLALTGEIETLVLDNITYLAELRWMYICKFEQELSVRTGEVDYRGMYGKLSRWLWNFVFTHLTSMPSNLVITCHEMMESDDAMDKKIDKSNTIVPSILGGFRNEVGGLVSLILYLGKTRLPDGKYKYSARTNYGMGKNAKSRYPNLPEIIENISYYTIRESIMKSICEAK